jgi:uncharacterized protein (TIRG00374 family)
MKYLKLLAGHLISIFFIYLLFDKLDLNKLETYYQDIHWEYFFLAMFINIISYYIHCLRWSSFFPKGNVNLSNTIKTILMGHMFNTILPSKAGELIRPHYYHKLSKIPYVTVLTTCFIERIFDGLTVLICLLISILYFGKDDFIINSTIITSVIYLLAVIFCVITYIKFDFFKKIIKKLPQNKLSLIISNLFDDFFGGLKKINNISTLLKIIFYTLNYWLFNIIALWAILYSLDLPIYIQNPMTAVFIAGIMGVALSLPSAPANIGVYHYAIFFVFTLIADNTPGVLGNSELFVLAAILIHLGAIIPDLILGAISYYTFPKTDNPQE